MTITSRNGGFTLIEVLVALVIVAFGIGALLTTLTSSADNVTYLREKSFAEWIALNRISEVRLSGAIPQIGSSNGEVEFAGSRWRWAQVVADQGQGDMRRLDVSVTRIAEVESPTAGEQPSLATAFGFMSPRVASPNGAGPDWSAPSLSGLNPLGPGPGVNPGTSPP
jgi:general secretion pathway protein I